MAEVPHEPAAAPDGESPGVAKRAGAIGCATGCAPLLVGLLAVLALVGANATSGGSAEGRAKWLIAAGGLSVAIGALLRASAAGDDEKHHARQRVPRLPPRLATVGEPAWITGDVVCPAPETAPHFGIRCAWLRERVTEKRGKHTSTVVDRKAARRVWLRDGDDLVELDLTRVELSQIPQWTLSAGKGIQRTLAFVPAEGRISACGWLRREPRVPIPPFEPPPRGATAAGVDTKSPCNEEYASTDDALWSASSAPMAPALVLGPAPDTPLLVTPLSRGDWNAYAETDELQSRAGGMAMLVLGAALIAGAAGVLWEWWDAGWEESVAGGLGGGLAVMLPLLAWTSLRRIRACRRRAEDAAAALESDLAHAADDPEAAGVRVEARLRVYDQLAAEHNEMVVRFPTSVVARIARCAPLPLRGAGEAGERGR